MNVSCSADMCPVILDSTCVFYSGGNLFYTGINTNDNLQTVIIKINNKFRDAGLGYVFNNGLTQAIPGDPVQLGGTLVQNTIINNGGFTFTFTEAVQAASFITTGGTSSQFVKGDGSLDSTTYQHSGNYITALTGDGVASGPGLSVFTLSNSGVIASTYGSNSQVPIITVDAKGRITNVTNTAINYPAQSILISGDVTGAGLTGANVTLTLNTVNTGVHSTIIPLKFSVNGKGLVTGASPLTNLDIDSIYGYTPIGDAPSNGSTYGRKNGGWVVVGSGGGATWGSITGTLTAQTDLITYLSTNYTPQTRTLTINGTTYDLSANRSWTVSGLPSQSGNSGKWLTTDGTNASWASLPPSGVSAVTASSPLSSTGGSTPDISIQQANSSQGGYLSSTDWNIFNNKFNLPSLAAGSVLFSNGTTIAQNNANFFWDNTAKRLDVNTISIGASTSSYIEMKSLVGDRKLLIGNGGSGSAAFTAYDGNYLYFTYSTTNSTPLPDRLMYIEPTINYSTGTNTHNILNIRPNISTFGGTTLLRGMYYNPNLISTVGITNIAWENTIGDIIHGNLATGGVNEMVTVDTNGKLGKQAIPSGGTVTSVDLSMPSAFSVANSPVTTSGTLTVTGAGTASQYIRGDGTLATLPTSTGGGSAVTYFLNGSINQGTFSGNTYYQLSRTAVTTSPGTDFTINSNGIIARFITDANDPGLLAIPGGNWNLEFFFSSSSSGGSPTFYVNVYKYNGTFTLIGTSSIAPEGITNGTTIDSYYTSVTIPNTTLSITDRIAIEVYVNNSGRTITMHTEDNHVSEVITTFSTGLTALNGLTAQVQYFATGTSGSDFGISSVTDTHTFNLPTASATNRGALSSSDWTTFNSKISRLVSAISSNTSAGSTANTDYIYLVSGTTTLTLPTAVGNTNQYTVKNVGGNTVSIATTSSQTIDGSSSPITINVQYVSLTLISDGSNWNII